MSNTIKPAGGQPVNLPAETSAKRSGTLSMSVHIPADFNPINELLAIADTARDLARAADATDRNGFPSGKRPRPIEATQVRDLNFRACLLAMRLSACTITIHREEAPEAAAAAPLALDLGQRREILDLLTQLAEYALDGWEEAEIPEAPTWRVRLDAAKALLTINTEASAK